MKRAPIHVSMSCSRRRLVAQIAEKAAANAGCTGVRVSCGSMGTLHVSASCATRAQNGMFVGRVVIATNKAISKGIHGLPGPEIIRERRRR